MKDAKEEPHGLKYINKSQESDSKSIQSCDTQYPMIQEMRVLDC